MINDRIEKLRNVMKEKNIFAYIIPSADYHQSEYVGEFFKGRQFISGFTGSAGTVVITPEKAILWTDGRYFLQADKELATSCVELYKMGGENVPTTFEYIENEVPEGCKIGFDGRAISAAMGVGLEASLAKKNITISYEGDLLDEVWEDRPALSDAKAFLLDIKYSGEDFTSKIARVRNAMKECGSTIHILTSLDDIAWLFNIRGGDVKYNPVVLSYAVVTLDKAILFVDENKLNDEIKASFGEEVVEIKGYFEIYEFVKTIEKEEVVLVDSNKINYTILKNIPEDVKVLNAMNPSTIFKAEKNEVEISNTKQAHIRDGVAVTKFMYWLKNNIGKIEITEISAADKMTELRKEQGQFIEPSFASIAGYGANGAIVHYSATEESNTTLEPKGLFLLDSGGQYFDGTTDITRTFALGSLTEEEKSNFTSVARAMIRLSGAKFLYGVNGYYLDILARGIMWEQGLNYNHGTGHGIGHVLNVHEAPNGFRCDNRNLATLEEGMITTNEPGFYKAGSHGIRLENEMLCKKGIKNEYGQFMEFEPLTIAPLDLDAIDVNLMNEDEKAYLNEYHKMVFDTVSPFLTAEETEWLKEYTRAI
ncbi:MULTISPECIES: aminopeptidase P family protein [Terrisporobacter]|uniref:Aminopeptidase P family protein n=1 Tax=Terrisporobacter muris TaxID=2963284 RepID=A0A9X2S4K1_9FIRM|nr:MULTISPECIES: aminopeptidase P family protein [Terrisporobacter]MCR1823486.1 aminopeptidase P family protein [Terrisporobacter muris]MDY3373636.1 aminopeptidase P family protein [Terrisporobacter othiniensis]